MVVKVSGVNLLLAMTIESMYIVEGVERVVGASNVVGIDDYEAGKKTARQREMIANQSHLIRSIPKSWMSLHQAAQDQSR